MFCKKCGKEIQNDSIFCPFCGTKQNEAKIEINDILIFVKKNKKWTYPYFIWIIFHFALLLSSTKENLEGFYPWNDSISYLLQYTKDVFFDISLTDKCNVYDISEFFVYTIIIPLFVFVVARYLPYFSSFYKKICGILIHIIVNLKRIKTKQGDELQILPIINRFSGTIIDMLIILCTFFIISFSSNSEHAISYIELLTVSPKEYEQLDSKVLSNYDSESLILNRTDTLSKNNIVKPYKGYTANIDLYYSLLFIFLNSLYFFVFEGFMSSSLGKSVHGGKIIDYYKDVIGFERAFVRGLCRVIIMIVFFFLLHFVICFNILSTLILFTLINGAIVFFTKRSYIDLITETAYVFR